MQRAGATNELDARAPHGGLNSLYRHIWAITGALLIVAGTIGSIVAANGTVRSSNLKSQKAFIASSAEIAATLKLAILHEDDLVQGTKAFVLDNPQAPQARFLEWTENDRVLARYPELEGLGEAKIISAAQLPAFVAAADAATASASTASVPLKIIPAGNRAYYCFVTIGIARNASDNFPPGYDFCAGSGAATFLAARDSGQNQLLPFDGDKNASLSLEAPIYSGGSVPKTIKAREETLVGWVGMSLKPNVLLATALEGYPNSAVSFRYGGGSSPVVFHSGIIPPHAQTTTINIHDGWTVQTFGSVGSGALVDNATALALLFGGILLSLLLGALIYALGTGRARATTMVRERTEELQFQALHDPLTGLPNRALILDRIELMLARSRRNHFPAIAMFLDLDDFKDINDTLGHQAGDQLLVAVGARLASTLRDGDTVGRLGGDEFVLLIEGTSLAAGAQAVADRILEVLHSPFEIEESDLPLSISASIGVATGDRVTPPELLRDADIALYRAKAAGKRCAVVFAPAMQAAAKDHRHLGVALHNALDASQFFLLYQPIIDLQSGAFRGVEALLRWRHPERGVVTPDNFIPALEASGLIVPVGAWVLNEACRQGAIWHAQGHRFSVSVNVSAHQLGRDRIIDDVQSALSVSGFDPAKLVLELTETMLINDVDETMIRLGLLKALGIRLAIDDFGTGYSSLSYLRQFPIDILKIDRSFVSGMTDSAESEALVHTLVQLAKALGLKTIAEGVEDEHQREQLMREEVDAAQGFLFSRPLDADGVSQFLGNFVICAGQSIQVEAQARS
jgi:diguanylate cyclase (GGDEF)-like protein